jgi:predicted amidohydrolase
VGSDGNALRYDGGTAVYGHDGAVLSECGDKPAVITEALDWQSLSVAREQFPVSLDADTFTLPA